LLAKVNDIKSQEKINRGDLSMQNSKIVGLSVHLAYLLRHAKDIRRDEFGWVSCKNIIIRLGIKMDNLVEIVNTDSKGRYEFSSEGRKVRAVQGHSVPVNLELEEVTDVNLLYHGTTEGSYPYVWKNGISKMSRNFVHLSKDKKTAFEVGSRHGNPVVIVIMAKSLIEDGHKIYRSKNGVYLTDHVAPKYFLSVIRR
jgi:putative RNA 2'-phosphotransferase